MKQTFTYQTELPGIGNYDVAVFGGGPAGVCAAVEAARNGAKTLLIESSGMLGGMATTALVGPLMTSYNREGTRPVVGGLYREIVDRLESKKGAVAPENTDAPGIYTSFIEPYHKHVTPVDSFLLQVVLDEMAEEAGVGVLLYSRLVDCVCENGRISKAIVARLQGLSYLTAKVYLDCTGNADLALKAGVPTWKGDEENHVPQPGTLMFEVDGVDDDRYEERPERPVKAYKMPQPGTYKINHFHVYNTDATDSESMSAAHREARKQVLEAFAVLRDRTPGFEQAKITQVAPVLGVRESRHIRGRYCLTASDLESGIAFEDRIAAYAFGMDVHSRNSAERGNFKIPTADVYYVPYRSMVPLEVDNLLVAGKTISCESQAAGAIRVIPCAMAMGQAAGAAASIAIESGQPVSDVSVPGLHQRLISHGAILD